MPIKDALWHPWLKVGLKGLSTVIWRESIRIRDTRPYSIFARLTKIVLSKIKLCLFQDRSVSGINRLERVVWESQIQYLFWPVSIELLIPPRSLMDDVQDCLAQQLRGESTSSLSQTRDHLLYVCMYVFIYVQLYALHFGSLFSRSFSS